MIAPPDGYDRSHRTSKLGDRTVQDSHLPSKYNVPGRGIVEEHKTWTKDYRYCFYAYFDFSGR